MIRVTAQPTQPEPLTLWHVARGGHGDRLGAHLVASGALDGPETWERVREEAVRVLSQCLPPDASPGHRTGLLLGYSQSSKRLSMTAVAALARDNGFQMVIALTGANESHHAAARRRLERDLGATSPEAAGWTFLGNPSLHRDGEELGRQLDDWRTRPGGRSNSGCLFITVSRHPVQLDQLARLLRSRDLGSIDVLLLDDGSDGHDGSGSLPPGEAKTLEPLRACLPRHTYLRYTAAAQAACVLSLLDLFSPDFVDLIESASYCGGGDFFLGRGELVRAIPAAPRSGHDVAADAAPASLLDALRLFFLGVAAELSSGKAARRALLVDTAGRPDLNGAFHTWIDRSRHEWTRLLQRPAGDVGRQELLAAFARSHVELSATGGALPPLQDLLPALATEISRSALTEIDAQGDEPAARSEGGAQLLIGGAKLACGDSIPGLTVTYAASPPAANLAGLLKTRDRFFGYKRRRLGSCRAFLPERLLPQFVDHARREERVRQHVLAHRGRSTRDLRHALSLDPGGSSLRPVAPVRPSLAAPTHAWFKQEAPHVASSLEGNARRVEAFLARHRFSRHSRSPHGTAVVPIAEVIELLGRFAFGPDEVPAAQGVLDQLVRSRGERPDRSVAVFQMQPDPRTRAVRGRNDETIALHASVGAVAESGDPGDDAVRDPSRVTLQIHWVRVVRIEGGREVVIAARVPALALHVPRELRVPRGT